MERGDRVLVLSLWNIEAKLIPVLRGGFSAHHRKL